MARSHFLYSRTRILFKSRHDRGPRRSLLRYMFCILAQGFSIKVAIKALAKAYCTCISVDKTFIISFGITHIFEDESCEPQDDCCALHEHVIISQGITHIYSKMSRFSLKMTVLNFMHVSLLPQELSMFFADESC